MIKIQKFLYLNKICEIKNKHFDEKSFASKQSTNLEENRSFK